MATTTATISLDRFRRRARSAADAAQHAPAPESHPLVGAALGTLARRYGLMASEETVAIAEVVGTSGDLAVADRLAFVAAMERHEPVVVVELEGWFVACRTERAIEPAQLPALHVPDGAPRIMSIATDRGITPALGPLVA